jgi:IstB-like ATP binding protein
VGYLPLARADANLVFQPVARRYERGSILLTSNKAFSEWGQIFGDDVLASAIFDRLLRTRHPQPGRPGTPTWTASTAGRPKLRPTFAMNSVSRSRCPEPNFMPAA